LNRSRSLKAVIGAVALATTVFVAAAPAGAKAGGNGNGNGRNSTNLSTGNVTTWQYWCDANGCYYWIPLT